MAANPSSTGAPIYLDMNRDQRFDGSTPWEFDSDIDVRISDAELTALALADGNEETLSEDAVPITFNLGRYPSMLSEWYMPPTSTRRLSGWRKPVVLGIIATLLVLEALGLCSIFGQVVIG